MLYQWSGVRQNTNGMLDIRMLILEPIDRKRGKIIHRYGSPEALGELVQYVGTPLKELKQIYVERVQEYLDRGYVEEPDIDAITPQTILFAEQSSEEQYYHPSGELQSGDYLGHFRIKELLGEGGQGDVYLASDTKIAGRPVAIKILKEQGLLTKEAFETAEYQFRQEVSLLGLLNHPSIPKIYEAEVENGLPYMVMEYIEGKSLQQMLEDYGSCPLGYACQIVLSLCNVLGYLHNQQPPIIFRDLKPSNIMMGVDGKIYLIDFGIARFFKPGQSRDTVAMGTKGFSAPELLHDESQTSPVSDIYSLGATMHFLISGEDPIKRGPFEFPSLKMLSPEIRKQVDALIKAMTVMKPEKRIQSMEEVANRIQQLTQPANAQTIKAEQIEVIPTKKINEPIHIVPASERKTVLIASASFLSDNLPDDKAACEELITAMMRKPMIRTKTSLIYSPLGGIKTTEAKKKQFLEHLQAACWVIFSLSPDLVQHPEGRWIVDQVMQKRRTAIVIAPMRTAFLNNTPLQRIKWLAPAPIDTTNTKTERKEKLALLAENIEQFLGLRQEDVA